MLGTRHGRVKDEASGSQSTAVANELEDLTQSMCYVFGQATKAVSCCGLAYYAEILCEPRSPASRNHLRACPLICQPCLQAVEHSGDRWTSRRAAWSCHQGEQLSEKNILAGSASTLLRQGPQILPARIGLPVVARPRVEPAWQPLVPSSGDQTNPSPHPWYLHLVTRQTPAPIPGTFIW